MTELDPYSQRNTQNHLTTTSMKEFYIINNYLNVISLIQLMNQIMYPVLDNYISSFLLYCSPMTATFAGIITCWIYKNNIYFV